MDQHGDRGGKSGACDKGIQHGGFADVKFLREFTPFRIAVVVYLAYQSFVFLTTSSNFKSGGGSAWGGVTIIALIAGGVLIWIIDLLIRHFITDRWLIWTIQLLVLLAMYLFLDW
jgi:hypothetical protein